MAITFTLDLEDTRRSPDLPARFPAITHQVLDALAQHDVRGTFFVVAELASEHEDVVRRIAEEGHEVALHGLRHVPLSRLSPETFARELTHGLRILNCCAGQPVTGFRAPIFSLVPGTAWALDVLAEAGVRYSSSVLPAHNPLHGWPDAPRSPFRWPQGMVELPCPVAGIGRVALPCLGGAYLRLLPRRVVVRLARRQAGAAGAWTYCHPYDFDPTEPFAVLPEASWLTSRLLHLRRRGTLERVLAVIRAGGGAGPPLGELAEALRADPSVPVFSPV